MRFTSIIIFAVLVLISSCKDKEEETEPMLVFKYTLDPNGERLDNFGEPAVMPAGNAAQTPAFNKLGVHSIELINYVVSLPTTSTVIYKGEDVTVNGDLAIDFDKEKLVSNGEVLVKIPLSEIQPGTYTYLRNSIGYQNYNIDFIYNDPTYGLFELNGEMASFVGFRTYIKDYTVGGETISVNDNKMQGYWGFHVEQPVPTTLTGQSPTTTVPNPLDDVSPIPLGSCLVTGAFETPLEITGNETEDIVVNVAITTNNSFEWQDTNPDGKYEPAEEAVVDMGTRGLKATIE